MKLLLSILTNNPVTIFFIRHAGNITFLGYTTGNAILFGKDLFQNGTALTYDTAAGAAFLVCGAATKFIERYPTTSFRIIGAFCLLGSVFLAISALNLNTDLNINDGKMIGAIAQATAGIFWGLQKEIFETAEKNKKAAKTIFTKIASTLVSYPIAIAAGIDFAAGSGLFTGALIQYDPGMQLAMIPWYIGVIAMVLTDPRIQKIAY